ncbi:MAG: hypothetical protein FE044_02770 [Thermoplasmata archaeon]|nr:MAG: hypothetical protein FE044_02770 [Thermoplasmata archaeon]
MRIQLKVEELHGGLKPFITFICEFPRLHTRLLINAFVDTGSSHTSIALSQLLKRGINVGGVIDKNDFEEIMIGGAKHKGHPIKERFDVRFRTQDNKTVHLKPPKLYVYLPYTENKEGWALSYSLPSIIGVDFLIHHNLSLYFNPSKKVAWLEKEE